MRLPIVLAAILPILIGLSRAGEDSGIAIAVNFVACLVFVVDLVVHLRLVRRYLRTGVGVFDLAIVVITAPWFLIPGLGSSQILVVARLGRLARLLMASPGADGHSDDSARSASSPPRWCCSPPGRPTRPSSRPTQSSPRTATPVVGHLTLTTVGYGDIVPHTRDGRLAGVFLMLTGPRHPRHPVGHHGQLLPYLRPGR